MMLRMMMVMRWGLLIRRGASGKDRQGWGPPLTSQSSALVRVCLMSRWGWLLSGLLRWVAVLSRRWVAARS